ncbi:MAG: anthranilate synthase component I [Candidatus Omnitrophota bacterium]
MEITPTLKDFLRVTKTNNLIVLSHTFYADSLTPVSIYHTLSKQLKGESFLLESVEGEEKVSRFSFLGFMPICTFRSKDRKVYINEGKEVVFETKKDPLYELQKLMRKFKVAPKENLRFFGGFVGYVGYDVVKFYEPVGKSLPDCLGVPDIYLVLPKFLIIFDHLKRQIEMLSFVAIGHRKDLRKVYAEEKSRLETLCKKMYTPSRLSALSFIAGKPEATQCNMSKHDFLAKVKKAKEYIKNGDIIQVVLSQRFSLPFTGKAFDVYRYLRILNPSPYMFYLNFREVQLAGSSPEMLLRCEHNELITRPIAGTRKRGKNEEEDKALERSLLDDPKEKAEHIMLVDLARNDVGRVAARGSVRTPLFMTVERFSHVMHIVSEVKGTLEKGENIFRALSCCFPAGTVSGAPKVRAMQIINELEPEARGIYAGSVGYFSFTNSLDTCIIIRTVVFKNNRAYIQAGAGIVSDSKPDMEYKETVNKAKAQVLAVHLGNRKEDEI